MKEQLTQLIEQALAELVNREQLPADIQPRIQIDRTRDKSHGDLASNIALTLAKCAKMNPRDLAQLICVWMVDAVYHNFKSSLGSFYILLISKTKIVT